MLNTGNFIHVLHVALENTAANSNSSLPNSVNWSALYPSRLVSDMVGMPNSAAVRDNEDSDRNIGVVVEMMENDVSMNGRTSFSRDDLYQSPVRRSTFEQQGSGFNFTDPSESSGSDTENDGCLVRQRDRRILTQADRDKEWLSLISDVVPRTSRSATCNINSNVVDTDSASDVELCANDTSSASESSFCTVKDISVRFDMLKYGDLKPEAKTEATTSRCNTSAPTSVVTRSQSVQRLHSPHKIDRLHTCLSPAANAVSSSESYSCNDDSDDSTLCAAGSPRKRQHHRVNDSRPYQALSPCQTRGRNSLDSKLASRIRPGSSPFPRWRSEDCHAEQDESSGGKWLRSRTLPRRASDTTVACDPTAPGAEYEFIDEIESSRHEKLSVFRKRRLADKKYEFSDENSENVPANYRSYRRQSDRLLLVPSPAVSPHEYNTRAAAAAAATTFDSVSASPSRGSEANGMLKNVYERLMSPASSMASPSDVLRPINPNIASPILSPRDDRWNWDWDKNEKVSNYCFVRFFASTTFISRGIFMMIICEGLIFYM